MWMWVVQTIFKFVLCSMSIMLKEKILLHNSDGHTSILDILQLQGSVSVTDLAEKLEVSEVRL